MTEKTRAKARYKTWRQTTHRYNHLTNTVNLQSLQLTYNHYIQYNNFQKYVYVHTHMPT